MRKEKYCERCNKQESPLFRVQYKPHTKAWVFLCKACVLAVKPGNAHYRYGGTWKR